MTGAAADSGFRLVGRAAGAVDAPAPTGGPLAGDRQAGGQQASDQLTSDQQAVAAHADGPLLVVGGPGTGKTTTLVESVARQVAEGADPGQVLVLTFGRRGAADLRRRVEHRLTADAGADGDTAGTVSEPLVRTVHAYAFGLLRRAAVSRGEQPPRLLTGPEQDTVIRELLAGAPDRWPARLQPALPTRAFARQLRDLLLRAAERGVDDDTFRRYAKERDRDDWEAAVGFRAEYEAVLALRDATARAGAGYDYAELVRAATGLLRADPALLAAERRRLHAVYVDEYADTDPAQRELLELVAGGGATLVAFADPDAAIYGFRGADPDGVRTFPEQFPTGTGEPAPVVTLNRSHRAGPSLLAAAARVARHLRGPARHRALTAARAEPPGEAAVRVFRSPVTEHGWVAHRLREIHLREQVPWARMAVVVRAGGQLARVRRALRAAGVPAATHAEDLPLASASAVAPLLEVLRCAVDPARLDEEAAVRLLHSPLGGADPFTERRLRQGLRALARHAGDARPSGQLLADALRDPAELAMVDRRWAAPAQVVARLLATARDAVAVPGATPEQVLWQVWRASGLAERWYAAALPSAGGYSGAAGHSGAGGADEGRQARAEAADRDLDAVVVLFDAAARFTDRLPGSGVEVFLDYLQSQQLPADTLARTADRGDAVRLLTAHATKGLEWDVVALPGVQEGVWPDLRLRGSLLGAEELVDHHAGRDTGPAGRTAALLEEERRLFYTALTRARRTVLVTAVSSEPSAEGGTQVLAGHASPAGDPSAAEQPSRFLRALAQEPHEETPADAAAASEDTTAAPRDTSAAPGDAGAAEAQRAPRGLTLPALVAELRTAVTDQALPQPRRRAAAAQLARLARAGVPGAHPDQWWGLRPLSDDRPLAADGETVRVSPSAIESALRCSLRWLLERHGGGAPPSAAQSVGTLVHATAMLADRADVDRAALLEWLDARFGAIEHAARWLAGPEHDRAEQMVDKLVRWVAHNPRRLVAVEREFTVALGRVQLRGRVDRLERDEHGRLVVVDLKTGKQAAPARDVDEHPQLAAYQAAVAAGGFADEGDEPGGAALVHLGTPSADAREDRQPQLSDTDDPDWAPALVRRAGEVMAGATFQAVRNDRCRVCPVQTSCPVSGHGRQVVQP